MAKGKKIFLVVILLLGILIVGFYIFYRIQLNNHTRAQEDLRIENEAAFQKTLEEQGYYEKNNINK